MTTTTKRNEKKEKGFSNCISFYAVAEFVAACFEAYICLA
jgi:hypothetical protein